MSFIRLLCLPEAPWRLDWTLCFAVQLTPLFFQAKIFFYILEVKLQSCTAGAGTAKCLVSLGSFSSIKTVKFN